MASCSLDVFDELSGEEEEFEGFRREDIQAPERSTETDSGESDFSLSEDEESDGSDQEVSDVESEEDAWTFDVSPVRVTNFEEDLGPSTILKQILKP